MIGCSPEQWSLMQRLSKESISSIVTLPEWKIDVVTSDRVIIIRNSILYWGNINSDEFIKLFKKQTPLNYWRKEKGDDGIARIFDFGKIISHKFHGKEVAELDSESLMHFRENRDVISSIHTGILIFV
jgi:hypothetical protein